MQVFQSKIDHKTIIELDSFITAKEADLLIENRTLCFKEALSHYPNYYRNNDRLIEDNKELAYSLLKILIESKTLSNEIIDINEKLRFCKYQKGQQFSTHKDGIHYRENSIQSKYTFLLYLNGMESFCGGKTLFYKTKYDTTPYKSIIPKKGKLVVFDHDIWHKGEEVTEGNKYILRSDLYVKSNTTDKHHKGYIWSLLKTTQNTLISCGRDTTIKLWTKNLQLKRTLQLHSKSVIKVIQLNSEKFMSCSRDFTLKIWNTKGEITRSITMDAMMLNLEIDLKANFIVASSTKGTISLLNSNLNLLKQLKIHEAWIWDFKILDTNNILTCAENGEVSLINLKTKTTTRLFSYNSPLFCLTHTKNYIISGDKFGHLVVFNKKTKQLRTIKLHKDIIRKALVIQDKILSCSEDGTLVLYDLKTETKTILLKQDTFIQDVVLWNNSIYSAGFDGLITKTQVNPRF